MRTFQRLQSSKWLMLLLIPFCTLLLFTSCTKKSEERPDPIRYRLKWLFNTSVVGDLWAEEKGLFEREGLIVEVKPGGPEKDAIKELELGHAQFGVASADMVIRAVSKGSPVAVIAQLFQTNPLQWIYRPGETEIKTPEGLRGKVIGVTFGGNDEAILRALLAKYGILEEEVELFSVRYDYTPFYERRVDLWPVYRNAQGIIIKEKLEGAGERAAFFDPHRAGVPFVANSVVTTKEMLQKSPEIVEKFTKALLAGWEASMAPESGAEAIALIHRFDPDTPLNQIEQQYAITKRMVKPSADFPVGTIDRAAWQMTEQIMVEQGLIPGAVGVARALAPVISR